MQLKVHYRKIYNDLEAKIKEIRLQVKVALKEKSDAQNLVSNLQSEISQLKIEHADWMKKKSERTKVESIHQSEVEKLNGIINSKNLEIDSLNKNRESKNKEYQIKEKFYLDRLSDLEIQIQDKEIAVSQISSVKNELVIIKNAMGSALQELESVRVNCRYEKSISDREKLELDIKKKDFEIFVNETNKRSQQNEKDRGTLEIWIRRLQKYYGESGINMNILQVFGLKQLDEEKK